MVWVRIEIRDFGAQQQSERMLNMSCMYTICYWCWVNICVYLRRLLLLYIWCDFYCRLSNFTLLAFFVVAHLFIRQFILFLSILLLLRCFASFTCRTECFNLNGEEDLMFVSVGWDLSVSTVCTNNWLNVFRQCGMGYYAEHIALLVACQNCMEFFSFGVQWTQLKMHKFFVWRTKIKLEK